ncbi:twin-arginine translocase TatA/TatE family subunit [Streptomyces caniferus]|uniref:twin-arginine translocase TatA/TatE family subunit n=1 Tax=Streptomyces caniferus TaxID=285557 RepID=UPI00345178B5
MFGISELAITLIVVIVIFGAKKLPERALSMGKSARILKSEAKAMKSDQTPPTAADAPSPEAPLCFSRSCKRAAGLRVRHDCCPLSKA